MKKHLLSIFALILPLLTFAQDSGRGIDEVIDEKFGDATGWFVQAVFYQIPFTDTVSVYWVLFPLIIGAIYFTIYFSVLLASK